VAYQLAYTGSANIDPKSIYPLEHFVAMLPKAMQFSAAPGTNYQLRDYPGQPDASVEVASGIRVGQPLAFKISGQGTLRENGGAAGEGGSAGAGSNEAGSAEGGSAPPESRPGGGLGPPIDAAPPLQKYQWWILGGFAAALIIGGIFISSRQQAANRAAQFTGKGLPALEYDEDYDAEAAPARPQPVAPRGGSSLLLEALKEELFQLEVERQQGRISHQEYETAKSALDQTLQRALKREAQKA